MSTVRDSPAVRAARSKRMFLKEFLANPGTVGAIAPSSRALAARMLETVDFGSVGSIVEFGPGTGAFTGEILSRLRDGTRFVAIEINEPMARALRERHPGVAVHHDSVANVREVCAKEGIAAVDVIVSGLPWASFPEALQRKLLEAAVSVLRPGGQFITFGYTFASRLPKGRRFRAKLPEYFMRVEKSGVVWRNLPPAFVMRCTR